MSTCISRHGEFSEHTLDDSYTCTLCGALDEDALRADLKRLRADLAEAIAAHARTVDGVLADGWESAAADGPQAATELPWALHTPEGHRRLRVHVWPSLEAPRTVSLAVADGWAEFTAAEIDEGILAMSEAVRRIREHEFRAAIEHVNAQMRAVGIEPPPASEEASTEALPSDPLLDEAFLNAKVRFWVCPDGHSSRSPSEPLRQTVEWRGEVAYCLEPGCGKTSAAETPEATNA